MHPGKEKQNDIITAADRYLKMYTEARKVLTQITRLKNKPNQIKT